MSYKIPLAILGAAGVVSLLESRGRQDKTNYRRKNKQEYPYSNATRHRIEQDAANTARRREDRKSASEGRRAPKKHAAFVPAKGHKGPTTPQSWAQLNAWLLGQGLSYKIVRSGNDAWVESVKFGETAWGDPHNWFASVVHAPANAFTYRGWENVLAALAGGQEIAWGSTQAVPKRKGGSSPTRWRTGDWIHIGPRSGWSLHRIVQIKQQKNTDPVIYVSRWNNSKGTLNKTRERPSPDHMYKREMGLMRNWEDNWTLATSPKGQRASSYQLLEIFKPDDKAVQAQYRKGRAWDWAKIVGDFGGNERGYEYVHDWLKSAGLHAPAKSLSKWQSAQPKRKVPQGPVALTEVSDADVTLTVPLESYATLYPWLADRGLRLSPATKSQVRGPTRASWSAYTFSVRTPQPDELLAEIKQQYPQLPFMDLWDFRDLVRRTTGGWRR